MPKCVLKRFEGSEHRFYYYDVVKNIMGTQGHARSINTEFGYYSQATETFLNNYVEKPLSDLLKKIDSINFSQNTIMITFPQSEVILTFVYSLIARSPTISSIVDEYSIFWSLLSDRDRHDFAAVNGIILAQKKKLLSEFFPTFTINKSRKPFILPMIESYLIFPDLIFRTLTSLNQGKPLPTTADIEIGRASCRE